MTGANACPVCHARAVLPFLQRLGVPAHQNLMPASESAALAVTRGDLAMVYCAECGFVYNRAFDLARLRYDAAYDNTQTCSPLFHDYLDGRVHHLVVDKGVQNCRIVEVGCGQGLFLRKLVAAQAGNRGYGFDPSYTGPATDLDGRLLFQQRYYDADCADIPADVVVCRHVIEHVPDPVALLGTIRQALAHAGQARVFFETPCVDWILRRQVIWDFFYEHCSLFTVASLTTAFETAGFTVERVDHVFGGQYLWLEATVGRNNSAVAKDPGAIPALATAFTQTESRLRQDWQARIANLSRRGRVALWGAGAKGVTLANLVDPQRQWLDCVVDLNPAKQGRFIPGTGHPIVAYSDLMPRGVQTALLMNPNYEAETALMLRTAQISTDLVVLDGIEPHEAVQASSTR